DVHWTNNPATNTANVFRSEIANQYIDVKLYTTGIQTDGSPFWDQYAPDAWFPIASSKQQLTLAVAAMNTADPSKKGTSASQHVDVTNENARGGIYYWTSSNGAAVWRYDIAAPDIAPAPFFTTAPAQCMGCHALSRDGSRIAVTLDGGGGRGSLWDVGSQVRIGTDVSLWDFSAFNVAADKVITIDSQTSTMNFRNVADSSILVPAIPSLTPGAFPSEPEISPDNSKLVNVEATNRSYDYMMYDGSLVVRSYDDTTNTFGAPTTLVAGTPRTDPADDSTGYAYYPSFSPDSQWVLFTKTEGNSYNNAQAETWVVKADGSLPPVKLAAANTSVPGLTNSWPRWVPFGQTFGSGSAPLFYLTFSSTRPYGQRIPGGGRPQIWMTPFFPDRAAQGQDPSGPAFRVPFQDVMTNNHIAQWTQQVVIQRNADGSLYTASDLQKQRRASKAAITALDH
ncbi:MAG TPA: hypothetical protein VGC41_17780, partial [Kofleriaceae bacterium]